MAESDYGVSGSNAFWAPINDKIERNHREAHENQQTLQAAQRQALSGVFTNSSGQYSDKVKNDAWNEYNKLLHPEVKQGVNAMRPIAQKVLGMFGVKGKQQPQQTAQAGPASPFAPTAAPSYGPAALGQSVAPASPALSLSSDDSGGAIDPGAGGTPKSSAGVATPSYGPTQPQQSQQQQSQAAAAAPAQPPMPGYLLGGKIFDTPAANKRSLDFAQQKSDIEQARQEAIARIKSGAGGTVRNLQYKLADGSIVPVQQNSKTGAYKTAQGEDWTVPEGASLYKDVTPGTRKEFWYMIDGKKTPVFQDSKDNSKTFDVQGKPFDLPKDAEPLDQAAELAKVRADAWGTGEFNKWKKIYKSTNPNLTEDQLDAMAGAQAEQEGLLKIEKERRQTEQIGATTSTERPRTVNGVDVAVPFYRRKIPVPLNLSGTPSAAAAPAASAPVPQPVSAPAAGAPPNPTAISPVSKVPARAPRAAPVAAPPGGRDIGTGEAQYRGIQQDARAISGASVPIFGDPTQPGLKSLQDYSDLAKDPNAVKRIGTAMNIIADLGEDDAGAAHASVGAGGISLGLGRVASALQNKLGITQAAAEQKAQVLQDALRSMTAREREYYNTVLAAREAITGLRRATGGASSKFAVDAMANTLPIIGKNVIDEAGYKDLLKKQAGIFVDGSRGTVQNGLTPEQKQVFARLSTMNSGPAADPKSSVAPIQLKDGTTLTPHTQALADKFRKDHADLIVK